MAGYDLAAASYDAGRINRIVLDTKGSNRDYPRRFEVTVSTDGESWSDVTPWCRYPPIQTTAL